MSKFTVKKILLISAAVLLMLAVVLNLGTVFGFVTLILGVLKPVVIGFCLAFILNIPMSFAERKLFFFLLVPDKKGKTHKTLARALSIVLTLLFLVSVIALILLVIVPQVTASVQTIAQAFPAFTERALAFVGDLLERFNITSERISEILLGGENILDKIGSLAEKYVSAFVKQAGTIGSNVISTVTDILLGIFLTIYFLAQKDLILRQLTRLFKATFKKVVFDRICSLASLTHKSFGNFISGQLIEAVILGSLCFLGMLIFKLPYASVVSVLVGVSALVPILGAWIGGGISALLILINNPIKAVWFIIFLLVLQQLENNLIYPKVVGKRVGLPGVWVLLAVIIGNGLVGALGALIAVPLTSVAYAIAEEFVKNKEKSLE